MHTGFASSGRMGTKDLGIEFVEEAILVESAARRKQNNERKQKSREKEIMLRKKIMNKYFLRMSTFKKKEFLVKLLENIRNFDSIMHIINFMPLGYPKIYNYSASIANANLAYDMAVIDHNRMLDEKILEETLANDLEFFKALPDAHQISFFIDLLRHAGGYFRRAIVGPLEAIFYRRLRDKIRDSNLEQEIKTKKVQIADSVEGKTADRKKEAEDDEKLYDPTHPSTIEVLKQRKKWNDIIDKYRKEVEKEEIKMKIKYGEIKPPAEVKKGKGGKGDKSKSSQKSSKKDKKGKKGKVEEEMDLIQIVPVWIAKKILGYLDQKTLKKMKAVNSYWAFIIQDLIADTKTRKKLDKAIAKLESQIDPEKVKEAIAFLNSTETTNKRGKKSKRVRNINSCGAIMKEMLPKKIPDQVDRSLMTDVENEIYIETECLTTSSKPFVTFPRQIKDDKLYKHIPCFLRDVRVILGVQEGTDKNISFLTYSLSSRTASSIEFDVDVESLLSW